MRFTVTRNDRFAAIFLKWYQGSGSLVIAVRRGRHIHRSDSVHREMLIDLRRLGFTVIDLSSVGDDCPDAVIGRQGITCLLEIKTPYGLNGEYRISEGQQELIRRWRGTPIIVGHKVEQVIKEFMRIWRTRTAYEVREVDNLGIDS